MRILRKSPLFRLILFFIPGILLGKEIPIAAAMLPAILAILAFITGILLKPGPWRERFLGLAIFSTSFCLGWGMRHGQKTPDPGLLEPVNCTEVRIAGLIHSAVSENDFGLSAQLETFGFFKDSIWVPASLKLILKGGPEFSGKFARYDSVYLSGYVTNAYSNSPSYLAYLHSQGIRHSVYIRGLKRAGRTGSPLAAAHRMQQYLSGRIGGLLPGDRLDGIGKAMWLGDRQELEREDKARFAAVGISHVLAISGLHIGIIFVILDRILTVLHLFQGGRRVKYVLILIILGGYAFITGAAPAVVRAVLMFGALLLGRIIRRRAETLNMIALSAWIQLIADPSVIHNIGFQLSYSAVTGIVIGMPLFTKAFHSPVKWLNALLSLTGVTLIAQLSTLPLVLAYFGQFPTWFLVGNVLTAPLAWMSVFSGFLLVIGSEIPFLNVWLGKLAFGSLWLLEWVSNRISTLPWPLLTATNWQHPGLAILAGELLLAGLLIGLARRIPSKVNGSLAFRALFS